MNGYVIRHPRTGMFIAKNDRMNTRYGYRCGFGQAYRWVRSHGDALVCDSYADAELPGIFLNLEIVEICPLVCGVVGEPKRRDEAMLDGTFHSPRAA